MLDDKTIEARFIATDLEGRRPDQCRMGKSGIRCKSIAIGQARPRRWSDRLKLEFSGQNAALHLRFICHQGERLVVKR